MQKFLHHFSFTILLVIIVGAAFFAGVVTGYEAQPDVNQVNNVLNAATDQPETVDFSEFWKVWNLIDGRFVNETNREVNQKRLLGAITGMVKALGDPYTVFLPPAENKNFEENITGNFGGIGIEIGMKDGRLTIISALEDTPAKVAGLVPNDAIIKIDDQSAEDITIEEAVNLIRGEIGTTVTLSIIREDDPKILKFPITRAKITIPTLETEVRDGVFVIRLYSFDNNSAGAFRTALRRFAVSGRDKLIIDLRGNPGGLLEAAVDIASWFVRAGEPVVIERGRNPTEEKVHKSYGYKLIGDNVKMAVLVDKGSASASEILAGALSEYGRAVLVGEQTFGKGSVQELINLPSDSSLKITVAKWYTPKGVSLTDNGLKPQVTVEWKRTDDEPTTYDPDKDPQLKKAIEIVKAK